MNTGKIVRLVALGFGMFLVLEAITSGSFLLADHRFYSNGAPYGVVGLEIVGAVILAVFLYIYSVKLQIDDSQISPISLFQAALKLTGMYLLIKAIPYMTSGVISLFFPVQDVSSLAASARPLAIGVAYAIAGYLLLFRTRWVVKKVDAENIT